MARGVKIDKPQVLLLEHEGAVNDIAVGDDESDVALPHFFKFLYGVTYVPQVRIGQKDVILKYSPEDAEMTVTEDFHRNDARLAQILQIFNFGLLSRPLVTQLFDETFHVQKRKCPQFLYLLLVAVLDKGLNNLLFSELLAKVIVEKCGQGG